MPALRDRFPGVRRESARFDGPAGTQMVDSAIDAVAAFARSGDSANGGGSFAESAATEALMHGTRETVARLLGGSAEAIWFGANMTTMTFAFTRALSRTWKAGDRIVGTRLDHDANVTTWRLAAADRGATMHLAPFDQHTGRLDPQSVIDLIDDRTKWVAITGASNLIGTIPDVAAIVDAAHSAGAYVFVDAVHLAPHRRIDVTEMGVDALVTSAYKWYGPHAATMWVRPELLESVAPYKVRPAPDTGPARLETGTPAYETLAGVQAAAAFLLEHFESLAAQEHSVFAPLLDGLLSIPGVRILGPRDVMDRTPTVAFTIDGHGSAAVAAHLAAQGVATWAGSSYAVEAVDQLGLAESGGVVRAGVVGYVDAEDVQRLLRAVDAIAS